MITEAAEAIANISVGDQDAPRDIYISRLIESLRELGSTVCVVEATRSITAADLLKHIYRYARAFDGMGLVPGQLVAIHAPNRWEALAVRYAANLLGAATTFLSMLGSEAKRRVLIETIAPDLLVVFPETAHLVSSDTSVPILEIGDSTSQKHARLDEMARACSDAPIVCRARAQDLAVVVSSGGTTGTPKGSCRSYAAYGAMVDVRSPADRRQLINGPLANLSQVLADVTLLGKGTVFFQERYEPVATLKAVEDHKITDLFLVEPQLFELMDHPNLPKTDLSSLRSLSHIGASAPPVLRKRARETFGPIVVHSYGASEEGLVSVLTASEADKAPEPFSTAGRVLPHVQLRFRRHDGALAEAGEIGILEISSPALADGYRLRSELDRSAFKDGWYRSGDLGYLDVHRFLRILGRATDVEIGSRLITPTMIEDDLCRMASIRYANVVVDHALNRWIAAILSWAGSSIDPNDCVNVLRKIYGETFVEKLRILPLDKIPLTPQGKPDREAIVALANFSCEL